MKIKPIYMLRGKTRKNKCRKNKNRFKKLKLKKREKKKKRQNSTELQKPNVEAEAYNNNKKCD